MLRASSHLSNCTYAHGGYTASKKLDILFYKIVGTAITAELKPTVRITLPVTTTFVSLREATRLERSPVERQYTSLSESVLFMNKGADNDLSFSATLSGLSYQCISNILKLVQRIFYNTVST